MYVETLSKFPVEHGGSLVVNTCRLEGCGFKSHSSHHVGTLSKSFTRSCLWRFGVKLRHSIRAVSGVPLSNSGLEEALQKYPEWMNECICMCVCLQI